MDGGGSQTGSGEEGGFTAEMDTETQPGFLAELGTETQPGFIAGLDAEMSDSGEQVSQAVGGTALEPTGATAVATALDGPTGLTAAATALDEPMGHAATAATAADEPTGLTAAATALDEPMGHAATAATAADEPTGLTAPAAATALDEPSGLTAAMAAGRGGPSAPATALEEPTGLTAAAATALDEPMDAATTALGGATEGLSPPPPPPPPPAPVAAALASPDRAGAAAPLEPGTSTAEREVAEAEEAAAVDDVLEELQDLRDEAAKAEEAAIVEELWADLQDLKEAPPAAAAAAAPAAAAASAAPEAAQAAAEARPADAAPAAPEPRESQFSGAAFIDESRYMQDPKGNYLHKWKVDYAARGGAGVAMCRDLDCLERHAQGGVRCIEKGELRIGRRVLMDKDGDNGHVVLMWYHARCIFNTFLRSRKSTRVIESVEDLEGFHDIQQEDQELLRRIIAGNEDVRVARSRTTGPRSTKTPEKRTAPGGDDRDNLPSAKKARGKKDEEKRLLQKGDRVWTFCRVRPPAAPDRPGGAPVVQEFAVKSPKPELGVIIEEVKDDTVLVQFESAEHEQERIEKYQSSDKRLAKIRSWFLHPRVFEGKKQRLPLSWIQSRPPPKLCGCAKQQWAHACDCGISCTRGTSSKVWGVCQ